MTVGLAQGRTASQTLFYWFAAVYWLGGMHLFMHNPGGSSFYLPFNMVGWAFCSLLIAVGVWQIAAAQRIYISSRQGWLWGGFALLLIPLFAHTEITIDAGLPKMLGIAAGLLMIVSLSQLRLVRAQRLLLLYLLLGAVAIEAVFGLVQYYLLTPGNWIGYNIVLNRPYGIFQQVNVLASFLATGMGIALYLAAQDPLALVRRWRLLLICAVLLMATLLVVVIQSRAGWIGAAVVTLLLLPQVLRLPHQARYWIVASLLVGVGVGLYSMWFGGTVRSLDVLVGRQLRTIYWVHALEMIAKHPLLGYGYGHFEAAFVNDYYAVPQAQSGVPLIEQNLDHPHNEILYWGVEGGAVALLGLLAWLYGGFRMLRGGTWSRRLALFALPFPLLFHSMVEYPFYHSVAHWLVLCWLIWFIDEECGEPREYGCRATFFVKSVALLIPLLTVPFMLTGLHTAYWVTKFERGGMKDLSQIQRVINPLPWYGRVMYDVMSIRLINALHDKNHAELEAYIAWATEFNTTQPRSQMYWNGALALDALGKPNEAAHWRAEGARLFPSDPLFKPTVSSSTSTLTAPVSGVTSSAPRAATGGAHKQ
jgi:O-antigen polymerase